MKQIACSRRISHNSKPALVIAASALLGLLIAALLSGGGAHAAQYARCTDAVVEFRVIRDFNWAERYTWQRGLQITRFSGAHEHRTEQLPGSEVSRRYCMAKAHFNNGEKRTVYYMISNIGGFVGKNRKVTHCIIGLDPWRNHDGSCRAIR